MSTAVSLGFTLGIFAAIASCALPFAIAALGLSAAHPGEAREGLRHVLGAGAEAGARAGVAFATVFLVALGLEEAGAEVSDLVPLAALVAGLAVLALAARSLAGRGRAGGATADRVAGRFGLVYAVVSLPGALWLFQGLVERSAESRGPGGLVISVVLFFAGTFAALIALAILARLCAAGTRRLAAGRAVGAVAAAAAGFVAVIYWAPAVVDGVAERGGAVGEAVGEVAAAIDRFAASYTLLFALVLLAAAVAALAREARRPAPA